MNTRLAANLSVIFTACMLVLSFSFGFHNYSEAQKAIVSDLNQALQQTIMQNSELWMNQDTLKTYSRLSTAFGNPVSIESYNKDFAEALKFEQLKDKSGIIVHVKNKKTTDKSIAYVTPEKDQTQNYLASDTVTVRRNFRDVSVKYPLATLMPKFMFLDALTYVQAGDAEGFKTALKALVEKYPTADVTELAGEMLKGILRGRTLMQGSVTGMTWNLRFGLGEDGSSYIYCRAEYSLPYDPDVSDRKCG